MACDKSIEFVGEVVRVWNKLLTVKEKLKADDMVWHGALMVFFGLLAGLLNYLYQLTMGRMLSPAEYGTLFSLISLSMIIATFTQTFQTLASRFTSTLKVQGSIGKVRCLWMFFLRRGLLLGIALFMLFALLSPVLGRFLNVDDIRYFIILASSLIVGFALPVNQGLLQGLQRFLPLGVCQVLPALLKLLLGVVLVYLGLGVNGALLPLFIGSVVAFAISLFFVRDIARVSSEQCRPAGLLSYTGVLLITIFSFAMLTNVDVVLAKHYLSPDNAGDYAAVSVLGRMALYIPMGIGTAMFPKTSELFDAGEDCRRVMRKAMFYTAILGGLIIGAYCLFFSLIVDFVFRGKYHLELSSVVEYGLAMLFLSFSFLLMNYFLSLNQMKIALALVAAMVVQLALVVAFHASVGQLVNMILVSSVVCLVMVMAVYVRDSKRYR